MTTRTILITISALVEAKDDYELAAIINELDYEVWRTRARKRTVDAEAINWEVL